jgi:hypothetical protein
MPVVLLLPTGLVATGAHAATVPPGGADLFTLPKGLTEVSGMAYGADGTLFVHQDSGSAAVVTALTPAGGVKARYDLGVQARDWEDMAAGPGGTLLVADIGDNNAVRTMGVLLHRIPEPTGPSGRTATPTSFRLTYEDGPHDAEALLVHPTTGETLVVTKGVLGSNVYAAPQPLVPGTLKRVGRVALRRTGTPGGPDVGSLAQSLVTGGAVSPDGSRLVVRTYTDAYVYAVPAGGLAAAFDGTPQVFALPESFQGEAVTFTPDGTGLVVTGEGAGAAVTRVTVALAAPSPSPSDRATPGPQNSPPTSEITGKSESSGTLRWVAGATVGVVLLVTATWVRRRRGRR